MGMSAGTSKYNSDINVTPMVDVMLVLLIIFMVITPLLQSGVNLTLPKNSNPDEDPNIIKDSAIVVSVPDAGAYYVKKDQVVGVQNLVQRKSYIFVVGLTFHTKKLSLSRLRFVMRDLIKSVSLLTRRKISSPQFISSFKENSYGDVIRRRWNNS